MASESTRPTGGGALALAETSNAARQAELSPQRRPSSALSLASQRRDAEEEPSGGEAAGPQSFCDQFNREFCRQLHVFGASREEAAHRGPTVRAHQLGGASGEALSQEELDRLFTPTQQELLAGFCDTHIIPDRLFNGDEVGGSTAPQRLMLSAHILATGNYRPGSFAQAVHARMCGHWVNLVNHYAGVSAANRVGIRESFDHTGRLTMSVGEDENEAGESELGVARQGVFDGISRRHRRTEEQAIADGEAASEHVAFRCENLPMDQLDSLTPGDWLYVFNDNGRDGQRHGGGNHSIIFSRYGSDWRHNDEGKPYRIILCMSQISPSAGGREETRFIGPHYGFVGNERITPITSVTRPSQGARPVRNADELAAALGTGAEARRNQAFIARFMRRRSGRFDYDALARDLRTENEAMIDEIGQGLDGQRMTPMQRAAFTELNLRRQEGQTAQSIGELVRLHQKLTSLRDCARILDSSRAESAPGVEERRARRADHAAPRIATQWRRIAVFDGRVHGWVQEEASAARDLIEEHGLIELLGRVQLLERSLATWWTRRSGLSEASAEDFETQRRQADEAERTMDEHREALWDAVVDARIERRVPNPYRRLHRRSTRNVALLPDRRLDAEQRLRGLQGQSGYHTAHITRGEEGRAAFNGRGQRVDGQLEHLVPEPDWRRYIRSE
ncbi:MAG: hypothetical protein EP330_24170 [Deltaproteobacteria bacterium]|nr:MAG: hypothetical protein EP330_24170 [Deltaproteobacteria bacterium]